MNLGKSKGYLSLKREVIKDCMGGEKCFNTTGCTNTTSRGRRIKCFHRYCDRFKRIIDLAKHYSHKTNIPVGDLLDTWEEDRSYWYMNYYSNIPKLTGSNILVVNTVEEFMEQVGDQGFRCPHCNQVSSNPYKCDSGFELELLNSNGEKKPCNWKSYGMFRTLGKGLYIFVKDKARGNTIFMPVALEHSHGA